MAETRGDIAALIGELEAVDRARTPPEDRGRAGYLRRQLAALDVAARRLLGESMTFADEIAAGYGARLPPADAGRQQQARDALARLLPGPGSLGERHAAFRRTIAVPRHREAEVLQAAIAACRTRTRAHIELPADEAVEVRLDADTEWDGFARYQGSHRSIVEISGRSPLDVSRALRLACHEAYPGHHLQHVLLDAGTRPQPELLLQPAFGPHLLWAEGAAEAGADLAFPPDDRARIYREVLLPRAGLPVEDAGKIVEVETAVFALESAIPVIVGGYLDSRTSREAAIGALAGEAAVMDPESLLTFAERQRTRLVSYVLGRQAIETWLARGGGGRWDRLTSLLVNGPRLLILEGKE